MAAIAEAAAEGLDVRLDVTVGDVDSIDAEAVVVTAPSDDYDEMLALLCVLDRPSAVPSPGGLQLTDDPLLSFVGDNQQKGISPVPALTVHARPGCEATLDDAARFIGAASVVESRELRWRHGRARTITGPGCVVTDAAAPHDPRGRPARGSAEPGRRRGLVGMGSRGRGARSPTRLAACRCG